MNDPDLVYGRYRDLIDDWRAFAESLSAPLAPIVWAHPERIERGALAALLAEDGISSKPLAWDRSSLVLDAKPGRHWAHWAGLFYVQGAASILPVLALDPRPGERILDLCAAPGGKTARIALALGNRGTVVANDRSVQRITALSATIARMGLCNVTATAGDGAVLRMNGTFDKVLVDAPCTAEGAASRTSVWRRAEPEFRSWLAGLQRALLRRAAELCRPGGRIVYSTCTFAPEENEAVVDAALAHDLSIVPIAVPPELAPAPGITAWEGKTYASELARTVRLWPHASGTIGFFVALLEKRGDAPAIDDGAREGDEHEMLRSFSDAFGFAAETFAQHVVTARGRYARIVADDHRVPRGPRVVSSGLPIARNRPGTPKLSTAAALAFGRAATRRVIELDRAYAGAFIAREDIAIEDRTKGYTIVRALGHPLGVGMLREGTLESEYPKSWSRTATGRW